jgi:hypothetical protein
MAETTQAPGRTRGLGAGPTVPPTYTRSCRAVIFAYPRSYRVLRGDEILSTLVDSAVPGQRLPRLADAADVVAAGLRARLGTPTLAGFDAGLVAAAPIALTLAAGISAFAWWRVEPVGAGFGSASPFLGVFRTVGPLAYLAWLSAALARTLLPAAYSRAAIGIATGTTVALPAVAALAGYDRPPLWVLMALAVFGVLAFAGTPIGTRTSIDERISVAAGTIGVALVSSALVAAWPPAGGGFGYYYQPTIARVGAVVAGTVGVVAGYALLLTVRGRGGPAGRTRGPAGARAQPWLWATALLGLPAGWLGPFDSAGLRLAAGSEVPHFGRLAQVLLATGVAAVTIAGLARLRTSPASAAPASLAPAGAATLGCAAGLAVFLSAGAHGWLGFTQAQAQAQVQAGAWSELPGHVRVTLVALVVAGVCGLARPDRNGPAVRAFLGGFAVAIPAAWLVAAYDNGWTLRGWPDFAHTAALVATLAFLPFAVCVVASLRLLAQRRRPVGSAMAMLTISLAWVGYAAVPSVLSWGPVVVVLLSGCAVLGITSVPRSPRGG